MSREAQACADQGEAAGAAEDHAHPLGDPVAVERVLQEERDPEHERDRSDVQQQAAADRRLEPAFAVVGRRRRAGAAAGTGVTATGCPGSGLGSRLDRGGGSGPRARPAARASRSGVSVMSAAGAAARLRRRGFGRRCRGRARIRRARPGRAARTRRRRAGPAAGAVHRSRATVRTHEMTGASRVRNRRPAANVRPRMISMQDCRNRGWERAQCTTGAAYTHAVRTLALASAVVALLSGSGCMVVTLQPAYDDSSIEFDEAWSAPGRATTTTRPSRSRRGSGAATASRSTTPRYSDDALGPPDPRRRRPGARPHAGDGHRPRHAQHRRAPPVPHRAVGRRAGRLGARLRGGAARRCRRRSACRRPWTNGRTS